MLKYAFISAVVLMLANWHRKTISQSTNDANMTYLMAYVYDPTNTKTETKLTLDYEFRV